MIHPDLKDGNICCTLQHFDSASGESPAYIALSYTWGNPAPRHTIYINEQIRMVHENLWRFLYRSWLNKCTDWLWTDSLCIDQANHHELIQQVVRMGDIYSQAERVISWLGESKTGTQALRTMRDFGGDDMLSPGGPGQASPAVASQVRRAWLRLIEEESYWERVWVFQEVACARKSSVVYGPVEVDFQEFLEQISKAMSLFVWPNDKSRDFEQLKKSWPTKLSELRSLIAGTKRLDFMNLLTKMSQGKCTRPVDRVYGLLGLAGRLDPKFDAQDLAVDYRKELDDVWWDVLFTVIDAPIDSVMQVRDVTRTVNVALGRSAYEKTPPFGDEAFKKLSMKGQRRAQLTCRVARALAEENRLVWLAPPELKAAAKHACSHNQQPSFDDAGEDSLVVLCLLASLKQPIWSMMAQCPAAKVPLVEGVDWLCVAHMPNDQRRRLLRREESEKEDSWEAGELDDLFLEERGACDSSHTSCNYSKIALALEHAGIVFFLTRSSPASKKATHPRRVFSAVEWSCVFCEHSKTGRNFEEQALGIN